MTIYTPYELETKGIKLAISQTTLELDGIIYAKGQSFPLSSQDLAEKILHSYLDNGFSGFLVSANQMLTLWRSLEPLSKLTQEVAENNSHQSESREQSPSAKASADQGSEKMKMQYRGAPIDTTVPDIAQAGETTPVFYRGAPVLKPEVSPETPRKKRTYRGVEY